MGYPLTIPSVRASLAAEKSNATVVPPCFSFRVAPAATPVAAPGRAVVVGGFPVLAYVQDESGAEQGPPLVIDGPGPVYLGQRARGVRLESVSGSAGSDAAYDVTAADDPRSWFEAAPPTSTDPDPRGDAAPLVVPVGTVGQVDWSVPRGVTGCLIDVRPNVYNAQNIAWRLGAVHGDGTYIALAGDATGPNPSPPWALSLLVGRGPTNVGPSTSIGASDPTDYNSSKPLLNTGGNPGVQLPGMPAKLRFILTAPSQMALTARCVWLG